jgi:hypothetical protein
LDEKKGTHPGAAPRSQDLQKLEQPLEIVISA